ncbi:MAG: FAD-dependent oxidoreductase [Chitinophagales bacterium]|nr:FAD-dependent oxidoreductase [Hyphomicrobiales bacterium]
MANVRVIGAGIIGLWQSLTLARRGYSVQLVEASAKPFISSASRLGAAMLAPYCEAEASGPLVHLMGVQSLSLWKKVYPHVTANGSVVIAAPRDQPELGRFARMTEGGVKLSRDALAKIEPALAERHENALYYENEAHVEPGATLPWLLQATADAGCKLVFGDGAHGVSEKQPEWVIDCRGMGAASDLPTLRGVKGEMLVVYTSEITLTRPVRLLHPRFPLYIAPWRDGRFMIGATVIESAEKDTVTVRSALDLLSAAFTVHPAFSEARIEGFYAGVRPAYPDNIPKITVRGRRIFVNGAYRHGYLLAPALAELVADYIGGLPVDGSPIFN